MHLLVDSKFSKYGLTSVPVYFKIILRVIIIIGTAVNGKDALDKLADKQPDVILMDYKMPVMYGDECTKIVKQRV